MSIGLESSWYAHWQILHWKGFVQPRVRRGREPRNFSGRPGLPRTDSGEWSECCLSLIFLFQLIEVRIVRFTYVAIDVSRSMWGKEEHPWVIEW